MLEDSIESTIPAIVMSSSSSTSSEIETQQSQIVSDENNENNPNGNNRPRRPSITSHTGTSPSAPQEILSSSADLSPGIPITTPASTPSTCSNLNPNTHPPPPRTSSPYLTPQDALDVLDHPTPRARHQQSSSPKLLLPESTTTTTNSRPPSQISFTSTSSRGLNVPSLNSPLCTPKLRDFAYPRAHKYHAPNFNTQRYSVSSRSSTSSDIDSFFPQRLGGQLYVTADDWKHDPLLLQAQDEEFEVDGEDEEVVERRAVCVFDFVAECQGEISIEIGQVVWVEFRKGVSGWLVVRDEITGLVPEGYVRFLNEEEERQYLEQSPPSNTLLPKNQMVQSGEATPRVTNQSVIQSKWEQHHQQEDDEGEWVDEPDDSSATETAGGDWVGLTTGVDHIQVER